MQYMMTSKVHGTCISKRSIYDKEKERKENRSIISSSPLTFQAKGSETSGAAKNSISSIAMPSLLNP